jgi:putative ABC transport system permease protein
VPALIAHLPADLPRIAEISVDGRVLAFTTLITLGTGIVFGLVPMVQSPGVRLNARGVSSGQSCLRGALIVGQVSLALVLLAGAGLMIKSLSALLRVSPGFQTTHILTARFSLPPRYANGYQFGTGQHRQISVFQRELADRVRAIPGVQFVGFTSHLPLAGTNNNWSFFIEGRPPNPPGVYDSTDYRPVTAGYFETIGIPIKRGRSFEARDDEDRALVVVINEAMARQFWPNENPVGKRLKFGDEHWRTIVGIVGDVHHQGLAIAPAPEMYIPWGQVPTNTTSGSHYGVTCSKTCLRCWATLATLRQTAGDVPPFADGPKSTARQRPHCRPPSLQAGAVPLPPLKCRDHPACVAALSDARPSRVNRSAPLTGLVSASS